MGLSSGSAWSEKEPPQCARRSRSAIQMRVWRGGGQGADARLFRSALGGRRNSRESLSRPHDGGSWQAVALRCSGLHCFWGGGANTQARHPLMGNSRPRNMSGTGRPGSSRGNLCSRPRAVSFVWGNTSGGGGRFVHGPWRWFDEFRVSPQSAARLSPAKPRAVCLMLLLVVFYLCCVPCVCDYVCVAVLRCCCSLCC